MKCIDETSDKISQEFTDLRDKLVRHINALLEAHLDEMAENIKGQKERLVIFVDTISDRQLLMAQYSQTLTDTEKTPPPAELPQDKRAIQTSYRFASLQTTLKSALGCFEEFVDNSRHTSVRRR